MEIEPIKHLNAMVEIPGSKSYTQRALIIGALADGKSFLQNALLAEDTEYLIEALRSLGSEISIEGDTIVIGGTGGNIMNPREEIYLGNNGTAMRLLTGLVSLGRGTFTLTGNGRLCERPIKPLLDALRILGVDARSKNEGGYPPVVVHANGLRGGRVALADIDSSQYVSSLLICAPFAVEDTVIELQGNIPSLPYIHMTIQVMKDFGVEVIRETANRYAVKSAQRYGGRRYRIEGDVSSASYFFLASALCGGRVRVGNINPKTVQGDIKFLPIMERLGCTVVRGDHWVEVVGGKLSPGEYIFDMGDMPDMVPTLSVLAAIRPGQTIIKNVSHLRKKESNRLEALVAELRKTGVRAEETDDGIMINGGKPHGAEIETYDDHRIAMSFAILGLRIPGIRIKDKNCVNKSFPGFWAELERLYSTMNIVLIGYRCTGKTSVGRRLSERFHVPFYDTDELIIKHTGKTIREIVEERGWESFRKEEKAVIGGLSSLSDTVIAAGGGAVMDPENREALGRNGLFIWLTADVRTIVERMKNDTAGGEQRPSLSSDGTEGETSKILKNRTPIYQGLADFTVDTSGKGIDAIAEEVSNFLARQNPRSKRKDFM